MCRPIRNSILAVIAATAFCQAGVVSNHGRLKIQNHKVVDSSGTPIQIAGMSIYWSTFGSGTSGSWGANAFFNSNVVATLANDWKSTLVRAPAGVMSGSSQAVYNYPQTMNLVKQVVDAAIANDIYVIVDWHSENSEPKQSDAVTFFTEMVQAYPKTPNIIWEIWNEPTSVSWATVKSYAETIIPIIRAKSPNLIICGTPNWSQDVDVAAANPLSDTNTAYALHFYAGSHGATLRTKGENAMKAGATLFISEWGTTNANGGGSTIYSAESDTWLSWAKANGISWANWSMSNKGEMSAALKTSAGSNGGWSANDLSSSGTYAKGKIAEVYNNLPITSIAGHRSNGWGRTLSARMEHGVLAIEAPAGTKALTLLEPSGRVLSRRSASMGTQLLPTDAHGLVLVRAEGEGESRTIPVMIPR